LIKERKSGSILAGFKEGPLKFKPTFKLEVGKGTESYTLEVRRRNWSFNLFLETTYTKLL